jgi:hypothetical protein
MKTRFNEFITENVDQTLHGKWAFYNDHIGYIDVWGWKNQYRFLDIETKKVIPLKNLNDVTILDDKEGVRIFNERNYKNPKEGENFSDRQKQYGKIHDNQVRLIFDEFTTGLYTSDFCRGVAFMISQYHYYKQIIKKYGTDYKVAKKFLPAETGLFQKYILAPFGQDCMYSDYCAKMGLHGGGCKLTEEEIKDYIKKVKELPKGFKDEILKNGMMKAPEMKEMLKQVK